MNHDLRGLVSLFVLGAVGTFVPGHDLAQEHSPAHGDMVVIVNGVNTSPDPTVEDLQAILTLERQFWKDGKRIVLILPPTGSAPKNLLLEKIYHRTDAQLRQEWARRLFAGEIPAVPTSLRSVEALVAAVERSPGAVAVIPTTVIVPAGVRVLAIGGKRPGQPGYALSSNGS